MTPAQLEHTIHYVSHATRSGRIHVARTGAARGWPGTYTTREELSMLTAGAWSKMARECGVAVILRDDGMAGVSPPPTARTRPPWEL